MGDCGSDALAAVPSLVAEPPRPRPAPHKPVVVQAIEAEPVVNERPLTERIVEVLAEGGGVLVSELVRKTRGYPPSVRRELAELEALGLVYRAGTSGASRWHLG